MQADARKIPGVIFYGVLSFPDQVRDRLWRINDN